MAKKDKTTSKKAEPTAKKSASSAAAEASSKAKKAGKERSKGKWHSQSSYEDDLATELAALGLRIKDITGDGNCFFRALGDQLEGNESLHVELRGRVMAYIAEREEDFAPFVEDDEAFGTYVARMRKDGMWAGYMEVVAASRCLGANLTIYQASQPRWRVIHHPEESAPMLHLSYHDGQHYNSVRCADDFGPGPPAPVVLRGDGKLPAGAKAARPAGDGRWDERDVKRVAASTACTDHDLVRRALEKTGGDVEAAIEAVIEALAEAETADEGAAELQQPEPSGSAVGTMPPQQGASGKDGASASVAFTAAPGDVPNDSLASAAMGNGPRVSGPTSQGDPDRPDDPDDPGVSGTAPAAQQPTSGATSAAMGYNAARTRGEHSRDTDGDPSPSVVSSRASSGPAEAAGVAAAGASHDGCQPPDAPCLPAGQAQDPATAESTAKATETAPGAEGKAAAGCSRRVGVPVGRKKTETRRAGAGVVVGGGGGGGGGSSAPSNNKRCPCGSNKKFKACCGPAAAAAERRRAAAGGDSASAATTATGEKPGAETVVVAQLAALVI